MRKNSYKFFQNKECEYFPCHKVECVDNFNCLFCYCPLYLQKNCIGTPSYFLDPKGQKIKDCSQCTVVHQPEMYEKVLERLGQKEEILSVHFLIHLIPRRNLSHPLPDILAEIPDIYR